MVEGTAGNTGIGLAHVCRAKGYACVIYMPNTQSQEKIDLLRMLGRALGSAAENTAPPDPALTRGTLSVALLRAY